MTARFLLAASLLFAACSADHGPVLTPSPSHASLFGQTDVTLTGDLAALGDIRSVTVGGIAAYDLRPDAGGLTVALQGAPTPGAVAIEVVGSRGSSRHEGAFTYDPPVAGVPLVWAAFGASYTHGCVSLGIDRRTQVRGISGDIARAAGVYLGLPLFTDDLMPEMQPGDFNADCSPKSGAGSIDAGKLLSQIGDKLTDPATGLYDLRRGRVDLTMTPRNVAVGGSKVSDVLTGGTSYVALLEHLVEDPNTQGGDALSKLDVSQIDRLEKLDPDVAFTTDLMGNDMDMAVIGADDLHPETMTDLPTMQAGLTQMMDRLGKLHGHYFIANMPSLTSVPNVAILRAQRVAAGMSTDAFDAKVQQNRRARRRLQRGARAGGGALPQPAHRRLQGAGHGAALRHPRRRRVADRRSLRRPLQPRRAAPDRHRLRALRQPLHRLDQRRVGVADPARRRRRHPRHRPRRPVGAARRRPDLRPARTLSEG